MKNTRLVVKKQFDEGTRAGIYPVSHLENHEEYTIAYIRPFYNSTDGFNDDEYGYVVECSDDLLLISGSGVNDSNDIEIFEGDVVCITRTGESFDQASVIFDNGAFKFQFGDGSMVGFKSVFKHNEVTITGNDWDLQLFDYKPIPKVETSNDPFDAFVKDANKQREQEQAKDNVNHPSHYNDGKYECIDVMMDVFGAEAVATFCKLNAFKYVWRSDKKNGKEDLAKARWYLNELGKIEEGK